MCDFVLSSDGDLVLYGASLIKSIDFSKGKVEVYSWKHVLDLMQSLFINLWDDVKDADLQILHICSFAIFLG